jgi:glucuronate isomerase
VKDHFLLETPGAVRLYEEHAQALPIIDFHNHLSVVELAADRQFPDITALWLTPDPYKHRLMRICGIPEQYITGDAEPFEKFEKFCGVFPYLAGNPVFDWSKMELSAVFGIEEMPTAENAKYLWDKTAEMLASPEFSYCGLLKKFNIAYQSPVAQLFDDLSGFEIFLHIDLHNNFYICYYSTILVFNL